MVRSNVFINTKPFNSSLQGWWINMYSWSAFFILGVLAGTTAFIIDAMEHDLVFYKWQITETVFEKSFALGWLTFVIFGLFFGGIAAIMTVFGAPDAAGGGTPELMGYFNGVNYPSFFGLHTLFVKVFGLGLATSSGLCIGKEGPLAHIGAILGHLVVYLPIPFF